MNVVNYGDDFTEKLTIRLTKHQKDVVTEMARYLGVSPSQYVRMIINGSVTAIDEYKVKTLKEGV